MTDFPEGDLKNISGIGPAMEKKLADLGVSNVEDLAAQTDTDMLAELIGARGVDAEVVAGWIAQAKGDTPENTPAEPEEPQPEAAEPEASTPAPDKPLTLHELNMRARAIDRQHAREREAARVAAEAAAKEHLKTATMRTPRRLQKNLRAPVLPKD